MLGYEDIFLEKYQVGLLPLVLPLYQSAFSVVVPEVVAVVVAVVAVVSLTALLPDPAEVLVSSSLSNQSHPLRVSVANRTEESIRAFFMQSLRVFFLRESLMFSVKSRHIAKVV